MKHITQDMVEQALTDPVFKAKFSEFNIPLMDDKGCKGCRRRVAVARATPSFHSTLARLSVPRLQAVRKYFGLQGMYVTRSTPEGGTFMDIITEAGSLYGKK